MRIAIFTDTFTPEINGVARTLDRFTKFLDASHIAYKLIAPNKPGNYYLSENVTRLTSLPFFLYKESRIAIPNPIKLNQQINSFQPSIIHVATPFSVGLFGLNYGKRYNLPMVASYHTNFDEYLSYYNLDIINKWVWNYMTWFHKPFNKVFVPSINTKEKLISNSVHNNIEIWSRGIDQNLFSPEKRTNLIREKYKIKEKYILLYVGRLAPEKNINIIFDSFKDLPPTLKNELHLIITGNGPMYESLSKNNSNSQITFTGFIHGEELAQLYASSDLFLFPSATETFGNVVLEANASGLPVIGAKAGGVQEIIKDGKTGILCAPNNIKEFTDAIIGIFENEAILESMKIEARRHALTYSWNNIFSNLMMHYEEVIYSNNHNSNKKYIKSA